MNARPFHSLTLLNRIWLNEEVFELCCSRPDNFIFLAGQHASLRYQDDERDYSFISAPHEQQLRFLIKRVEGGTFSARLADLPLESELAISDAQGYLIRPEEPSSGRKTVFVATGVGVAPFVSMVKDGARGFTLIHGARFANGLFYQQVLARAAMCYVACLSGPAQDGDPAEAFRGRVSTYISNHLMPGMYDFYLCGARPMLRDVTHFLDQRFPEARVYSESFT